MNLRECYDQDVQNKSCAACAVHEKHERCDLPAYCGPQSEFFLPMSFEAYEKLYNVGSVRPSKTSLPSGTGGGKYDEGKPEIDLVPTQVIKDIAEVRMYGTEKYGDPDNWKQVDLRRYVNALLRHTLEFLDDHLSKDKESGIPHYKHMACNIAFICSLMKDVVKEALDGK